MNDATRLQRVRGLLAEYDGIELTPDQLRESVTRVYAVIAAALGVTPEEAKSLLDDEASKQRHLRDFALELIDEHGSLPADFLQEGLAEYATDLGMPADLARRALAAAIKYGVLELIDGEYRRKR